MLTGTLVTLRAPQPGDRPVLKALRNDVPLQIQLMAEPRPNGDAQVDAWLERRLSEPDTLFAVIAEAGSDQAAGFCQLTNVDRLHGRADLGICLAASARGRGYAAEAIRLLERHAQEVLGLRKVVLKVLSTNEAARRLYAKVGYRTVGVLRAHFRHAGVYHDVEIMEHMLE